VERKEGEDSMARGARTPRTRGAIVGAGAAGLLHALALRAHGVDVVLVFDPNTTQARSLAELCGGGANVCLDVATVARSDVECVCICSPPAHHVEQALACAREGRLVFVEKPVAVTPGELARLADAPGCVPIVQWRWGRAIRAMREAIARGHLGSAPTVSVDLAWRRDEAYFRKRPDWGCGALLSVGIHAIDAVCYALDRPVASVASFAWPGTQSSGETSAALVVSFLGGASAAVRATLDGGPDETRMSFCGGGVTGAIVGSEADPTASNVVWRCEEDATLRRLRELERATDGSAQGPLIVPYMGRAIGAWRSGRRPGECDACPSVRDVVAAHDVAMRVSEAARAG
jgi:predicted dehydrogenase